MNTLISVILKNASRKGINFIKFIKLILKFNFIKDLDIMKMNQEQQNHR